LLYAYIGKKILFWQIQIICDFEKPLMPNSTFAVFLKTARAEKSAERRWKQKNHFSFNFIGLL